MTEIHVLSTPPDAARAAATFVADVAEKAIRAGDRFTIALSGGSTPHELYRLLSQPPLAKSIAWARWEVFWSDERCVPPEHEDSNYRLAKKALLDRVRIPAHQVHRMRGEASPDKAAAEYEEELRNVFPPGTPEFDLILLGVGQDGHTASLFDETDAVKEKERLVVANWVPHLDAYRITFTLPLINAARAAAFLVTDQSKAEVLGSVIEPCSGIPQLPASRVRPVAGSVHWFLTIGAANQLTGGTA